MDESSGGSGGRNAQNKHCRRLVRRASREHWPITTGLRALVVNRLAEIVADPESGPRQLTAACRAILAASRINLGHISVVIKADLHEEIEPRLQELERRVGIRKGAGG
jgi:hypothetical protein